MIRGAAANALRKKQPSQRRPAKSPVKSEGLRESGDHFIKEGLYDSDKLSPKLAPFDIEQAFRVKFSKIKSGNEEWVYYKDDEDRFTQR